jgi:hypothetical protein
MARMLKLLVAFMVAAVLPATAGAALIWDLTPGTGAPPSTLGGFTMIGFPDDPRDTFLTVFDVPSPMGGDVGFPAGVSHREVGDGWATWSHGYTGDVYFTNGLPSLTITLPVGTSAFYFYVEPEVFSTFTVTAIANGFAGTSTSVNGLGGAQYFGVYGTGGSTISSIVVSAPADANGFAVGEFGIATQEPGTLLLLGSGITVFYMVIGR